MSKQLSYEKALAKLISRSHAAIGSVEGMSEQEEDSFFSSLKGPAPSGGDQAQKWIVDSILKSEDERFIMFHVGGPGNGKSKNGRDLRRNESLIKKEIDERPEDEHYRTYHYQLTNGQKLRITNDATISREDRASLPSTTDLKEVLEYKDPLHFICNINRGILTKELYDPSADEESVEFSLLTWLLKYDEEFELSDSAKKKWEFTSLSEHSPSPQLLSIRLKELKSAKEFTLLALHMDIASLLERNPEIEGGKEKIPPKVTSKIVMSTLDNRDRQYDLETAGGEILDKVFSDFLEKHPSKNGYSNDPIFANMQSLKHAETRNGVLKILRSAEIVSSSKMSYRTLWEAVNILIFGRPEQVSSPHEWLSENCNQDKDKEAKDELAHLLSLADMRFHQGLMGSRNPFSKLDGNSSFAKSKLLKNLVRVDPVTDAQLGNLWDDEIEGWASPIFEAFDQSNEGESILKVLRNSDDLKKTDPFILALTDFDDALDIVISKALDTQSGILTDSQIRDLLAWYGQYLTRLYAVTHGIPAHHTEIEFMIDLWNQAQGGRFDQKNRDRLRQLLMPEIDSNTLSGTYLPPFGNRTTPYVGGDQAVVLFNLDKKDMGFDGKTIGDKVFCSITFKDNIINEIEIDYPVAKELNAIYMEKSGQSAPEWGLTDKTKTIEPRIERIRSSLLPRPGDPEPEFKLVVNGNEFDFDLHIEESQDEYR